MLFYQTLRLLPSLTVSSKMLYPVTTGSICRNPQPNISQSSRNHFEQKEKVLQMSEGLRLCQENPKNQLIWPIEVYRTVEPDTLPSTCLYPLQYNTVVQTGLLVRLLIEGTRLCLTHLPTNWTFYLYWIAKSSLNRRADTQPAPCYVRAD